jgi:beta-galactosidase
MRHIFSTAFLFFALVTAQLHAQAPNTGRYASIGKGPMPVGAYYYPEHWSPTQWERDIKRMAELGFSFTHFAEFAWAALEPEEGQYNFGWLDTCVNLAAKYGLKVIMCTPSPCPPAWLTQKHPEILVVGNTGIPVQHGMRLNANGSNPVYQQYIEKIIRQMAARYGNHPAVWGWQLDNEPHFEGLYDYSAFAQQDFKKWLQKRYGSIDSLNKAWGAAFWSLTYNNFGQIRIPNAKESFSNPHAILDFQRYNADALAAGLRFQAQLLRSLVAPRQWITTNYAYYKFLPSVDLFRNRPDLDFASHTMYLLSTFLNAPKGDPGYRLGSGMELAFSAEMARSINGFTGIMELQPGQINWGQWNSLPLPGAVRMWIWHSFGLGDQFVCTYRFRQPLFGSEQFHKGIMEPDGVTVSPGGKEYVQAIQEINALPTPRSTQMPAAVAGRRTAFLWKQDNLLGMEGSKHTNSWDSWQHYYSYYSSLKRLGASVTFLQETDSFDVRQYPVMVAPAYEMVDAALLRKWQTYVANGGTLVLSCRTGMKNNHGHLWESLLQAPIWPLIGAKVTRYDQLPPGTTGSISMQGKNYPWQVWADLLEPQGATVLATHSQHFYQGSPVVVKNKLGKGQVYYVGAWSHDDALEYAVLQQAFADAGAKVLNLPPYVFVEWRSGYYVGVNYSSEPATLPIPANAKVLHGQANLKPGEVAVWME